MQPLTAPVAAPAGDGAAPPQAVAPASFAEPRAALPADEIDLAIAQELAAWQPMLAPMTDPVQALLERARADGWTAQQVSDALPGVLASMDTGAMTAALARLQFSALAAALGFADPGQAAPGPRFAEPASPAPAPVAPPEPAPAAIPAIELHVHPVIQAALHLPELPQAPAPQVLVTNQVLPTPITVQPAEVTVLNQHPARAEQTVERDANDEIVKTITTYHQE